MGNNTPSGGQSCLAVIVGAILFILGPIVIMLYSLTSTTTAIKICFAIGLLLMILCFTFISGMGGKFGGSAVVALIYAIIFCSWYSEYELQGNYNDGGLGDLIGMFVLTFTLMVPCFLIGVFFEKKINEYKSKRKTEKINQLDIQIKRFEEENTDLERKIVDREVVLRIVSLLGKCGGNIAPIETNSSFSEISSLEKSITANKEKIHALKLERNKFV